jgi:hypothetical protein
MASAADVLLVSLGRTDNVPTVTASTCLQFGLKMLNQDHQVPEDHQVLEDQQADQQQQ